MTSTGNGTFADYVTSTAFSISLSKAMVGALDNAVRRHFNKAEPFMPYHIPTYQSLERRGLIAWRTLPNGSKNGIYVTEAGFAMHRLLILADLCEPLDREAAA